MGPISPLIQILNKLQFLWSRGTFLLSGFLLFKFHPIRVRGRVIAYREQVRNIVHCGASMHYLSLVLLEQHKSHPDLGINELLLGIRFGPTYRSKLVVPESYHAHLMRLSKLMASEDETVRMWGRLFALGMPLFWSYVIDWVFYPLVILSWVFVGKL